MLLIASAVALSLQVEAGVLEIRNPTDDQYVLYHGNDLSYGVQMTSPVVGIAPRLDVGNVVLTAGFRDMGHQYIDTDIIPDPQYFACRYKGNCPKKIERWHLRMGLTEFYGSVGYKFHVHGLSVIPTVGLADERAPNKVTLYFPYEYQHGRKPVVFEGDKRETQPFLGVDVEDGRLGAGLYYMTTNRLPWFMGDPGQGEHGIYARVTYRFGGAL